MVQSQFARVGVVLASEDCYSNWYGEIVRQIGIVCEIGDEKLLEQIGEFDVIVLCGNGQLSLDNKERVRRWLGRMSTQLLVTGSFWDGEFLFDIVASGERYSRNRIMLVESEESPMASDTTGGIFIGGEQARKLPGSVLAQDEAGNPLISTGSQLHFYGPHLGKTAALIVQGRGVSSDGIGPNDLSCYLEDGFLRAEDGIALEWGDRESVDGDEFPAFLTPHADFVRDQFARLTLHAISQTGLAPALLWHLPGNADSAFTVGIECDGSTLGEIKAAAGIVAKFAVRPAWLVLPSGLSKEIYKTFTQWGHDIGHLYLPEDQSIAADAVRIQNLALSRSVGNQLTVIKGADGAWFGLTRFYDLATTSGALTSMCKEGRQPGTSGFAFGTSRPFCPQARKGKYELIEYPAVAFAPGWVTSNAIAEALIEPVKRHHGVYRFDFKTSFAPERGFENGVVRMLLALREAGLKNFSPSELSKYERNRRSIRATVEDGRLELMSDYSVAQITVMVGTHLPLISGKHDSAEETVLRYGQRWRTLSLTLESRIRSGVAIKQPQVA